MYTCQGITRRPTRVETEERYLSVSRLTQKFKAIFRVTKKRVDPGSNNELKYIYKRLIMQQ